MYYIFKINFSRVLILKWPWQVLYFVHLAKKKLKFLSLWGQITNTSSTASWIVYLNAPSVNRTHNTPSNNVDGFHEVIFLFLHLVQLSLNLKKNAGFNTFYPGTEWGSHMCGQEFGGVFQLILLGNFLNYKISCSSYALWSTIKDVVELPLAL